MTEDASLDAFAGDGTDASGDDDEAESPPAAESDTPAAASDVDPAASTYDWSPDGGECADCGASVERRWRDGGALVCADCKEW